MLECEATISYNNFCEKFCNDNALKFNFLMPVRWSRRVVLSTLNKVGNTGHAGNLASRSNVQEFFVVGQACCSLARSLALAIQRKLARN